VHPVISRDLEELNAALEQARSFCSVKIQQQQQQQRLPVTPAPPPQGLQVFGLANAEAQENSPAEINISTTTDFPVSALPFTGSSVFRYIRGGMVSKMKMHTTRTPPLLLTFAIAGVPHPLATW